MIKTFWYNISSMSEVVYTSNVRLERKKGPMRTAHLPGENDVITFSVRGAIAKHYGVDAAALGETHAAAIDYVVAATAG